MLGALLTKFKVTAPPFKVKEPPPVKPVKVFIVIVALLTEGNDPAVMYPAPFVNWLLLVGIVGKVVKSPTPFIYCPELPTKDIAKVPPDVIGEPTTEKAFPL
jgi:hypothetical protein